MEEIYVTVIGLIAGSIGYLIANFWFHPILRYRDIRSQVMSDLVFYANAINAKGLNESMQERLEKRIESNRRHSADLAAVYVELPKWYVRYLTKRDIYPDRAVTELIGLSNTFEWDDANKRVESIQKLLNVNPRVV